MFNTMTTRVYKTVAISGVWQPLSLLKVTYAKFLPGSLHSYLISKYFDIPGQGSPKYALLAVATANVFPWAPNLICAVASV